MELHANFLELNMLSQIRALPNPAYKSLSGTPPHPLTLHLSPTSTANVIVTSLTPAPGPEKAFAKISGSPEVIVAPKTRAKTAPGVAKERTIERSLDGRSAASTSRTKSRRSEAPQRQAVFLRGIHREVSSEWFDEEEDIDQDVGLKVWVDWSILTSKEMRGVTWVTVSIVRPSGLQAPLDPQQAQEQDALKPSSRIIAQICPWEEAPDSRHVAVSTTLASVLALTHPAGETVRLEAAPTQTSRQALRSLKIAPFPATGGLATKTGFQFGSKSRGDREQAARRILAQHSKEGKSRLFDGPLTDGMIVPAFEDSMTGASWPGGILKFDPTPEMPSGTSKTSRAWFLGSDRKTVAKSSNEGESSGGSKLSLEVLPDAVKSPNTTEKWSVGQPLPSVLPHLVGISSLIEQVTKLVSYGSSVLLTGGRGSGKSSVAQVVAHQLSQSAFFHTTYFTCNSLNTDETRLSTVKETLNRIFGLASWGARNGGNALIVLDDLDAICPAETELQTNDNGRSRQISELVISMTKQYCSTGSRVVLIATGKSKEEINNVIIGGHVVRDILNIAAPDKETRRDILREICSGSDSQLSNGRITDEAQTWMEGTESGNTSDSEGASKQPSIRTDPSQPSRITVDPAIDFLDVAGRSDGFMPGDLLLLASRARSEAIIRSTSTISASLGTPSAITLTPADFTAALKGFTPSSLRNVTLQHSSTTFASIGGLHATRKTLLETLQYPTLYAPIFAKCPLRLRSGLLLYGYPGCGKTLLASAVAGECGLNFISVKGPEILNKYIGASEKSVRDLFERAQAARPCVLFFDEFDSVAPKRGHDSTGVTDRVVNQLLTQMDGAEGLSGVYVLAATSRPDLIDPALLRPGRLDKSLLCDMPGMEERVDILRALSGTLKVAPGLLHTGSLGSAKAQDMQEVARRTEGYSGADLQAVIYNAHLEAIHDVLNKRDEQSGGTSGSKSGPGRGAGSSTKTSGPPKNIPDFTYFRFGTDASADANGTATQSAASRAAERAQIAESLAAHKMAQARARAERKGSAHPHSHGQHGHSGDRYRDDDDGDAKEEKENQEPTIHWVHIEKSLETTRPSVSKEERRRLERIYREFVVGRNGEMPSGQGGSEIGGRSSLM